jgi:tetratricopeptide (TPR) repeat protein
MKAATILLLGASCCVHAFSQPKVEQVIYEVCVSPGCLADGAQQTLQKLQALAPPGCFVKPGVCCSLCGNGPIVMSADEKKPKKYRKVKGMNKVMEILCGDQVPSPIPHALVEGYEISMQAEEAFQRKSYEEAVSLYGKSISIAFRAAMDLQAAREKTRRDNLSSERSIPVGLQWLIKARRNEASSRLAMGDLDGAILAAQASCNIARNRCPESLEVLAEIYQREGNAKDELQALNNLFDLAVEEKSLSTQIANRRRELGFRRAKLEREVGRLS